ncbi:dCMP deaminase family protein [Leptotrichia sp. OH3620_COT-345]|uniref:deoxycytidylate deaminase n=1 Tax=Leptotrichia sp. OH3620_COT-345 TaxID=2491048 RepID=UPI000F64FD24|nr:dCMP deaminase family protein [Leptotrichia sp. OH3620_COT-345]RRD40445.1 dCMP deaminase family protein [Leptotrichia sp. OH3620_COT-345]
MPKRKDYLSWDEYFMGIAFLSGMRSKDPSTQVGACIIDEDRKIIGIGYNGFPVGSSDDSMPWNKDGDFLDTKYPYVVHAELNAILNSIKSLKNCTIYVTHFPCNECAKAIVQSGIKKVIYFSDKHKSLSTTKASQTIFKNAGVITEYLKINKNEILIKFQD